MIFRIYAVRDRATDEFGNPMFLLSDGQASRSFVDEVNRSAPDNNVYLHPDDFDLYHLGTYDTTTGTFVTDAPHMICIGKTVKVR